MPLSFNVSADSLISNCNESSNVLLLQQAAGINIILEREYGGHMPLYKRLHNRQKMRLANIQQLETYHIIELDFSINPEEGPTLRQMVMELKCNEYLLAPLIHSVDLD